MMRWLFAFLSLIAVVGTTPHPNVAAAQRERHYLYVASPGIRNYVEYGGIGVLVYDMDNGHKFVKRIPTFPEVAGVAPENVDLVVEDHDLIVTARKPLKPCRTGGLVRRCTT